MLAAPHLSPADFAARPRRSDSTDDLSALVCASPSPPRARPPLPIARTAAITATDPSLFIRGYGERRAILGPGGSTYATNRGKSASSVAHRGTATAAASTTPSRLESMSDAELAAMGAWPTPAGNAADTSADAQPHQQQQRRQCASCRRHFAVDRIEKHAAACVQARAETRLNTSPGGVAGLGVRQTSNNSSTNISSPGSPAAPRRLAASTISPAIQPHSARPLRSSSPAQKKRPQSAAGATPGSHRVAFDNATNPSALVPVQLDSSIKQAPSASSVAWRKQYLDLQQGLRDASASSAST
jgi:hypothetical protein